MHYSESLWIRNILSRMPAKEISPVLNLGSSTENFRNCSQSFINNEIFAPLKERGVRVIHTDIKAEDGVDLVGDLLNKDFRKRIKSLGVKCIICSNLLEHVEDPHMFYSAMLDVIDSGIIIVTVPHRYPRHMDPIDTMYRPTPVEVVNAFGNLEVIDARLLDVGRVVNSFLKKPQSFVVSFVRLFVPFYRFRGWVTVSNKFLYMFFMRKITCVALRKY